MKIEFDGEKNAHLTFSSKEYNEALDGTRKLIFSLVKPGEDAYDAAISLVIAMSTAMRAGALAEVLNMRPEETFEEVVQQNRDWAMHILQHMMSSAPPKPAEADVSAKKQEWYQMGEGL